MYLIVYLDTVTCLNRRFDEIFVCKLHIGWQNFPTFGRSFINEFRLVAELHNWWFFVNNTDAFDKLILSFYEISD